ncbi:MAG: hypothetical protein H6619_01295 [Deltaproteobacteria bacterium]|nr:hypothetical protein [Deltaproteobacteria bacterium]
MFNQITHPLVLKYLPAAKPENYDDLFDELLAAAKRTSTGEEGQKFAALQSFVPVETSEALSEQILVIDVGGTYVRVALRAIDAEGNCNWQALLRARNYELIKEDISGTLFSQMRECVVRQVIDKLEELSIDKASISGLGIVWSNALNCYELKENGCRGVSGQVVGKDHGKFYVKGEPWNPDLHDGDDIGLAFLETFKEFGFKMKAFVISNDTIFTQKTVPEATSGMVASTGTNVTYIEPGEKLLRNSEAGNAFIVPEKFQHKADQISEDLFNIECFIAGRAMQRRFASHLVYLAKEICSDNSQSKELRGRCQKILDRLCRDNFYLTAFKGKDLTALVSKDFERFLELREDDAELYRDDEFLELLRQIALNIVLRGGTHAAMLAYVSVYNQLENGEDGLVIALDSSQAHLLPFYYDAFKQEFNQILKSRCPGKDISVELIDQGEGRVITVPMRGAASAVNDFLAMGA